MTATPTRQVLSLRSLTTSRDEAARRYLEQAGPASGAGSAGETWMAQFVTLIARADAVARGVIADDVVTWVGLTHVPHDASLAPVEQVLRRVVDGSAPVWIEDVAALEADAEGFAALGWSAVAALPLVVDDHVIGSVVLGYRMPWIWTEHERRVLESWTQQGKHLRDAIDAAVERERARWRAAEERYRLIFESAPNGVILVDRGGRILMANRAFATIVGRDRDRLMGSSAFDFIARAPDGRLPEWAHEWIAGTGGTRAAELTLRRPDGAMRLVRLSAIGLATCAPEQRALAVAIVEDVTERRAIEASLRDHAEQLQQAQKMEAVGQLAGGLAHDFNNTLAVILGLASLLKEDLPDGDPRRADAAEILSITQRASGITRRLLQLSRRQRTQVERMDLRELLVEFEGVARKLLPGSIHLATITAPVPVWVRADRTHVEQVLMNLLINARDAMPRGGSVSLELHVAEERMPDRGVVPVARVSVTDTGTGIPADIVQKVWEPFFTTKGSAGTGLGLPTSRSIVREYGGELRVDSCEGKGSTFTMVLGLVPQPSSMVTTAELMAAHGIERFAGRTILLAEDEEAVRVTTRRMLERAGFEVLTARHGADAWLRFNERRPDIHLLVTDLVMPELSGPLLVQRVRDCVPGMPVIGLSGYSGEEWREYADSAGPLYVLQKPFTSEELFGTVVRAFEQATECSGEMMRVRVGAAVPAA